MLRIFTRAAAPLARTLLSTPHAAAAAAVGGASRARAYAAAASADEGALARELPKVPLRLHGKHAEWATAIYAAANEADVALDTITNEMGEAQALFAVPEMSAFLGNKGISAHDKVKEVTKITKEAGVYSDLMQNYLVLLVENGLGHEFDKIADAFNKLMKAHRREVDATLISATPLTADQMGEVQNAILNMVGKSSRLVLETKVDPSILGGLVLYVGDKHVDVSLAKYLEGLDETVTQYKAGTGAAAAATPAGNVSLDDVGFSKWVQEVQREHVASALSNAQMKKYDAWLATKPALGKDGDKEAWYNAFAKWLKKGPPKELVTHLKKKFPATDAEVKAFHKHLDELVAQTPQQRFEMWLAENEGDAAVAQLQSTLQKDLFPSTSA